MTTKSWKIALTDAGHVGELDAGHKCLAHGGRDWNEFQARTVRGFRTVGDGLDQRRRSGRCRERPRPASTAVKTKIEAAGRKSALSATGVPMDTLSLIYLPHKNAYSRSFRCLGRSEKLLADQRHGRQRTP